MYNLFLGIAFSTVCTALTVFLLGCGSAPDMQLTCKADPPTVRGKGITILSVDVPKIKASTALTFAWKQLKPEEYKGKFSSRADPQVKFLAPVVPKDSTFTIRVTAEEKKRVSHSCDISLVVEKKTAIIWDEEIAKIFATDKNKPKITPAPPPVPVPPSPPPQPLQPEFVKFYASDTRMACTTPCGYNTRFLHSAVRFISYDLGVKNWRPGQTYHMEHRWYLPDGLLWAKAQRDWVTKDSDRGHFVWGVGYTEPGNWSLGTHRVELHIDGQKFVEGSFTIE